MTYTHRLAVPLHYIFTLTFISFFAVLFCFAKKERATGAPKTMTARYLPDFPSTSPARGRCGITYTLRLKVVL